MAANWHDANMNVVANKPTYGRPRTAAPVISQFGKKGTTFDARADRAREDAREMANLRKQGRADAPPVTATAARGLPQYTDRERAQQERLDKYQHEANRSRKALERKEHENLFLRERLKAAQVRLYKHGEELDFSDDPQKMPARASDSLSSTAPPRVGGQPSIHAWEAADAPPLSARTAAALKSAEVALSSERSATVAAEAQAAAADARADKAEARAAAALKDLAQAQRLIEELQRENALLKRAHPAPDGPARSDAAADDAGVPSAPLGAASDLSSAVEPRPAAATASVAADSAADATPDKDVDDIVQEATKAALNVLNEMSGKKVAQAAKTSVNLVRDLQRKERALSRDDEVWSPKAWAITMNLHEEAIALIMRPLESVVQGHDPDARAKAEIAYLRVLGEHSKANQRAWAPYLLRQTPEKLASVIADATEKLTTGYATVGEMLTDKFMHLNNFHLVDVACFYKGIDGCVGQPRPDLWDTMLREHTCAPDSKLWFTTSNYFTHTTSEIEWYFVVDPEGGKKLLRRNNFPSEGSSVVRRKRRFERPLDSFDVLVTDMNQRLRAKGRKALLKAELVGARLYTGPMYAKYNAVMRAKAAKTGEDAPKWAESQFTELCKGNLYSTTIWVLNSAIVKLKTLTPANKVYRGVSKLNLPQEFRSYNEDNVRGGVEPGFMSTTLDKSVAMDYANGEADGNGVVFEIHQGLIDRGCDLSWLSQYPFEREILFAPLTGLEVLDTRVEGSALIVEMRPTINQSAQTIDEVISKLQHSHVQFLDLLMEQFKTAGLPQNALKPLLTLQSSAAKREPTWFLSATNYLNATKMALQAKEEVFINITATQHWGVHHDESSTQGAFDAVSLRHNQSTEKLVGAAELPSIKAERIFVAARLCADEEKVVKAIELLELSFRICPMQEGPQLHPRLRRDDFVVVDRILSTERSDVAAEGDSDTAEPALTPSNSMGSEGMSPSTYVAKVRAKRISSASRAAKATGDSGSEMTSCSEVVRDMDTKRRLVLVQMLLQTDNVAKWAPTLVELLKGGKQGQLDLILRCFLQLLEFKGLIDPRPVMIGRRVLGRRPLPVPASQGDVAGGAKPAKQGKSETWEIGRILAIKRNHVIERKKDKKDKVGDLHTLQTRDGEEFETTDVLPLGHKDAGAILRAAAGAGHIQLLQMLLKVGVHPLSADNESRTALEFAVRSGHVECVTALIDEQHGGKDHVFYHNAFGFRPYDYALAKGGSAKVRARLNPSDGEKEMEKALQEVQKKCELIEQAEQGEAEDTLGKPSEAVGSGLTGRKQVFYHFMREIVDSKNDAELVRALPNMPNMPTIEENETAGEIKAMVEEATMTGVTALMLAAYYGYAQGVAILAQRKANLEAVTVKNQTSALIIAAEFGHLEVMKVLVEEAEILGNLEDGGMEKPKRQSSKLTRSDSLTIAEKAQLPETVVRLVRQREKNGSTALMRACQNGHEDVCKFLLELGANPNQKRTDQGRTPLIMAARTGSVECVKLLLEKNADTYTSDTTGYTVLLQAAKFGHADIVNEIAMHRKKIQRKELETHLTFESDGEKSKVVEAVIKMQARTRGRKERLQQKAEILRRSSSSALATTIASNVVMELSSAVARQGKPAVTIQEGAPPRGFVKGGLTLGGLDEVTGKDGPIASQTSLILAAKFGHDEVALVLLRHSASVEIQDDSGMTALMWACRNGYEQLIPFLLTQSSTTDGTSRLTQRGKSATAFTMDMKDADGQTALMHACQMGHVGVAEMLVDEGADVFASRADGMTALMLGSAAGYGVELLPAFLHDATEHDGHRTMPAHLKRQESALDRARARHALAEQHRKERTSKVLDVQDGDGRTALMHAARNGHGETVRALLQAGANRYLEDKEFRTAKMLAFMRSFKRDASRGGQQQSALEDGSSAVEVFTQIEQELTSVGAPLIAHRMKITKEIDVDDGGMGVGAIVLDAGTGGCKLIAWFRFRAIKMKELDEVKLKDLAGGTSWEMMVEQGEDGAAFQLMCQRMEEKIDELMKLPEAQCVVFTHCFAGVTAWFRQLKDHLKSGGRKLFDHMMDRLSARLRTHKVHCGVDWREISSNDEARYETKAVDYALFDQHIDAPVALLAGGSGSVQLSGLDGVTSFDMPLKKGEKMISEGIERGAREEGIAEWEQYLKDCTKESELANMLNKLAQYAQDEGGEPVRIVMISAFWYLGLEAKLVNKGTKSSDYAYQPMQVVLDAVRRVRRECSKPKEVANAVRLEVLLTKLFDELYTSRVECLIARDWQLDGGTEDDFRTTWSAGWWLNHLVSLFQSTDEYTDEQIVFGTTGDYRAALSGEGTPTVLHTLPEQPSTAIPE